MRFWPFGNDKDEVEFASRVVTATARDGATVRGKVSLHFGEPLAKGRADELADGAATLLREAFERTSSGGELLGAEVSLAATIHEATPDKAIRSVEVVAVHLVGDTVEPPAPRNPPSSRPPPTPPPPRRMSSSQMFAVRDSRLIPEGATPEIVSDAIVPLLRDAKARTLIGLLRGYDLTVLRSLDLDPRESGDFGELVPQSMAAPGRFEDSRGAELARWEAKLGEPAMNALRDEAATVAAFFLHSNLAGSGLDPKLVVTVLDRAATKAFPGGAPQANLARYLQGASASSAAELAARTLSVLKQDPRRADALAVVITPTLQSLQDDFAFVAQQIMLSGVRST